MEEVLEAAETAGLEVEAVYDAFTTDAPKEDSERLYYILRRRCAARSNPYDICTANIMSAPVKIKFEFFRNTFII